MTELVRLLVVASVLATLASGQRVCDFQNASDTPQTSGCTYCILGTNEGCQNNGTCYMNPMVPFPICGCSYGLARFQCAGAAPQPRLCDPNNPADSPLMGADCEFCHVTGEKNAGCQNGGICYIRSIESPTAPPNFQITVCGCTYGLAPPTCAVEQPQPRLCNASNPADSPLAGANCEFCHVTGDVNAGCQNGGICYVRSIESPTAPPNFQITVCGCTYEWDPPTCARAHVAAPLCDKNDPSVTPPACEYCILGTRYPEFSGCDNLGQCSLERLTGPGFPPLFETPLCSCQVGWVPPTCSDSLYNNSLAGFGDNSEAFNMRFIYVALFAVIGIIAVLMIVEYFVRGTRPMPKSYKDNIFGLVMVTLSAFFQLLYFAINQNGIVFGYSYASLWFQQWFLNSAVGAAAVAIWVVTSVWISISVTTIRNRKGWPRARMAITIGICIAMFGTAIILASYQAYVSDSRWMFLVVAVVTILQLSFCIMSTSIILSRIAKSDISNAKERMRRLTVQLLVVCVVCLLAIVVLLILVFLPPRVLTTFDTYYFLEVFFPVMVLAIFLSALMWFFRLSEWKAKVQRGPTSRGGSTTRGGSTASAKEETFRPGDISALEEADEELGNTPAGQSVISREFAEGVIEL